MAVDGVRGIRIRDVCVRWSHELPLDWMTGEGVYRKRCGR